MLAPVGTSTVLPYFSAAAVLLLWKSEVLTTAGDSALARLIPQSCVQSMKARLSASMVSLPPTFTSAVPSMVAWVSSS